MASSGRGAAAAFLERFGQIGLAAGEAGTRPKSDAGADRDRESEQEERRRSMCTSLRRGIVCVPMPFHQIDRPDGEKRFPAAAPKIASTTLSVRLWRSSRDATRADRDPNRHLPFACRGAGEEHGGEIGAGDEEDERDRAEQE